ncbi:threonine/serine exporter family protein [Frigoribacterium salinisoli]
MRPRSLLSQVSRKLSGQGPASPVSRRTQRALLAERTVRSVLELAVRVGETLLSLGAAATDVTEGIRRVCRAFGIECAVDLTFTSILVVHDGGDDSPGVSVLRVVEVRTADYERLARVTALLHDLTEGPREVQQVSDLLDDAEARDTARHDVEDAHARLDAILVEPHRYRRGVVTLVLAVMAAGVALLLGGGPLVVVLAAATTALIDTATRALHRWGLPPFFQQIAGAVIATSVAVGLLALLPSLPVEFASLPPSLVVASGIVVLLAGMSLVGAADDAINGFPLTASGRLLEVVLLTLGIVIGIGAVLDVGRTLGVELVLVDSYARPWPAGVQVLGAALAAGAWAVSSHAPPRAALVAAAAGAGAWLGYDTLTGLGSAPLVASAAPALVLGLVGEWLGDRTRVPAGVTTVCGIVPLLPGLMIYQGVLDLTSETPDAGGTQQLLQAGMVGVGLAGGVTLGRILYRRLRTPVAVVTRPVRNRRRRVRGASTTFGTAVLTDALVEQIDAQPEVLVEETASDVPAFTDDGTGQGTWVRADD